MFFKDKQFKSIQAALGPENIPTADTVIQALPPEVLNDECLIQSLSKKIEGESLQKASEINPHQVETNEYLANLLFLLEKFGFTQKKRWPAKVQHRWKKALDEIEFFIAAFKSQALLFGKNAVIFLSKKDHKKIYYYRRHHLKKCQ